MTRESCRRHFLKLMASLPFAGRVANAGPATKASGAGMPPRRDYYAELGIRPVINGVGVVTRLGGSLMAPEVMEAMDFASRQFVDLVDLNEKAGARLAKMLRCEDALVSCGAASAITLATAATITGKDPEKIVSLPNLPGPKREVVMQKGHLIYARQFWACGVKTVEVEGPAAIERAINKNTVMAFFFNAAPIQGIDREEFLRIARKHQVPTFIDCASDVPPVENLFKYTRMGFDLVTFSGGKAIGGPQSAGLLFGRKELVEAARLNHSPHKSIGRGMKVGREEIIGMIVALELYLARDHLSEWERWERGVEEIAAGVRSLPSVVAERFVPPMANHVPHLKITWSEQRIKISPAAAADKLRRGDPAIEPMQDRDSITYNMLMLQPEVVPIVAARTREILAHAAGRL